MLLGKRFDQARQASLSETPEHKTSRLPYLKIDGFRGVVIMTGKLPETYGLGQVSTS